MQKIPSPRSWLVDVLGDRADVVAQVLAPGGLDAGEDAHAAFLSAGAARLSVSQGGSQPRSIGLTFVARRDDLVDPVEHARR